MAIPLALTLLASTAATHAQSTSNQKSAAELSDDELAAAVANSLGPVGVVPVQRGFTGSLITSSQHDSISGWSNVFTPAVAYRFNRYVSADVATPIFLYLRTESATVTAQTPGGPPAGFTYTVQEQHGIVADTFLAVHVHTPPFAVRRHLVYNTVTPLLIAPTGSVSDGVGAGKTTWNLTDHIEAAGASSPYLDLGIGSSSRVQNRRLQQDQTSRGTLANFAAGMRFDLPRHLSFAAEAFEQLPLGTQRVSQTGARPGGPEGTQQQVVTSGLAENNGFNTALDIPLNPHLTLSGFYSRSLRQHEDIAGFSFTFLARHTPRVVKSSSALDPPSKHFLPKLSQTMSPLVGFPE